MIQVFDPTVETKGVEIGFAPRLETLTGKVVGLVENTKHNSDKLLWKIARLLDEEYHFKEVLMRRKPSSGKLPAPEVIDEVIKRCDLVITGIGD